MPLIVRLNTTIFRNLFTMHEELHLRVMVGMPAEGLPLLRVEHHPEKKQLHFWYDNDMPEEIEQTVWLEDITRDTCTASPR